MGPAKAGIGQRRGCQSAPKYTWGASSPLRGRIFLWKKLFRPARSTIRVVAFRASHPANPPPRQRRFIQRFPKRRISVQENLMQRDSESSGNALPDIAKRLLNLIDKNQA